MQRPGVVPCGGLRSRGSHRVQHGVVAGDGARLAVRAEAADARACDPGARQARHAAHHVHRAGADGVVHTWDNTSSNISKHPLWTFVRARMSTAQVCSSNDVQHGESNCHDHGWRNFPRLGL